MHKETNLGETQMYDSDKLAKASHEVAEEGRESVEPEEVLADQGDLSEEDRRRLEKMANVKLELSPEEKQAEDMRLERAKASAKGDRDTSNDAVMLDLDEIDRMREEMEANGTLPKEEDKPEEKKKGFWAKLFGG